MSSGSCPAAISASTRMGRFEPSSRMEKSAYFTGARSEEYFRWRSTGRLQMVPVTEPLNVFGCLSSPGDCKAVAAGTADVARTQPRQSRTKNHASFPPQGFPAGIRKTVGVACAVAQDQRAIAAAASAGAAIQWAVAVPRLNKAAASRPQGMVACCRRLSGEGVWGRSAGGEFTGGTCRGEGSRWCFQKRWQGDYGGALPDVQKIIGRPWS